MLPVLGVHGTGSVTDEAQNDTHVAELYQDEDEGDS